MKPLIKLVSKISNILDSIFPKFLVVRPQNTASATVIWEAYLLVSVNHLRYLKCKREEKRQLFNILQFLFSFLKAS